MPSVLIIYDPRAGIYHDARVLMSALRGAIPDIVVKGLHVSWPDYNDQKDLMPQTLRSRMPFDAVFYMERLFLNQSLAAHDVARRRVYIPNAEWILEPDMLALRHDPPDAVLCKTDFTAEIIERMPGIGAVPVRAATGWSSEEKEAQAPAVERDYNAFLHVRGISQMKQTDVVIETWLANPDFPKLTVVARSEDDSLQYPVVLRAADNIEIHQRNLSDQELLALQRRNGIHLSPSLAEGFGHSLNEARMNEALLITTDGQPMKNMVTDGETGFLVPVNPADITDLRLSRTFKIRPEALAQTVRRVLALSPQKRREMGVAGRKKYLEDRAAFHQRVAKLFGPGGQLAL